MYWLFRALRMLGASEWSAQIQPWRNMLAKGLTTWSEDTGFGRSLCHGWSAHPISPVLECIAGVRILEPGWKRIRISPDLGCLQYLHLKLPTPEGPLDLSMSRQANGTLVAIQKPVDMAIEPDPSGLQEIQSEGPERAILFQSNIT